MNSIKWIREALFGAILLFVLAACSDSGDSNPVGPGGNADQNLTDDKPGAPDGVSGDENRDSDDNGGIGIVPGDTDESGGEVLDPDPGDMVAEVTHPLAVEIISRADVADPGQHGWAVMSANGELLVELYPANSGGSAGSSGGGTVVDPAVDPEPGVDIDGDG